MAVINKKSITGPKRPRYDNNYYKWASWYSNPLWRKIRDNKLRTSPLCECCLAHGRIEPAVTVHHMVPFGRGVDQKHKEQLFFNEDNLMSICKKCHSTLHNKDRDNYQPILNYLTDNEYEEAHGLKFLK